MLKRLAVYCGARAGQDPSFMEMATDFGHQMAEHDVALVYGGGRFGLMGAVADAVLEAG
ncbi:TIGR00730 family Rossman fold protein, partial [Limosilactobacillus fermentum]|nr:TIGR00730 family Rossman fold protein [Limosilactobacillus fermentum]